MNPRGEIWMCMVGSVSGSYGVSLWKNIIQGCSSLSHYILYEIGDG